MRLAQPADETVGAGPAELVVTDPLTAMQYGSTDRLLLALLNHHEGMAWANADPQKRGPFAPTLLPGYGAPTAAADDPDALAEYFARMLPPAVDVPAEPDRNDDQLGV